MICNNYLYQLFVGIDVSKGKADAVILKVSDLRSVKPVFLRKRLSFKFVKSEVSSFLEIVRNLPDEYCTHISFGLEVTGVYSQNLYQFIRSSLKDNESVRYLNTNYVNEWRLAHHIPKSDPLDAQTIASIMGTDDKVLYVDDNVFDMKKGYQDLKVMVHRHHQVKKSYSQEINRLIATCDSYFPELQYVFEPKSATFLAILSSYPTTYDIINASKTEVFNLAAKASKHHMSMDKIDKLFDLCNETLLTYEISEYAKSAVLDLVANIKTIRERLKKIEKDIKALASQFEEFEMLQSITGCGAVTAATAIAEAGDIERFRDADHFASYAGCAPKKKRSGSSVDSRDNRLTSKGSRLLSNAVYMIAEFGRRHNPVLKHLFQRIKQGNRKLHKKAVSAVANRISRYIYSILKHKCSFVIEHEQLMRLPEETRNTFFNSITLDFPDNTRKQIYQYSDEYGEVHKFVYKSISKEPVN